MQSKFDVFSSWERPSITLCNPNFSEIYSLNAAYNTKLTLRWNAQSEFSFSFPATIDGTDMDAFTYLEGKRIVLINEIGYFIINSVNDTNDGSIAIKEVSCLSLDSQLNFKKIISLVGTYQFCNLSNLTDETTLIGVVSQLIPSWTFSEIDESLQSVYRTFDTSDVSLYDFLVNEVSQKYNCIFIFDILNKTISVILSTQLPNDTDIFLSHQNLIENTSYQEVTEEIVTAMSVNGGNELNIRSVNPLATNYIYNFSYYMNTDWMSGDLVAALQIWQNKITANQTNYINLLSDLNDAQILQDDYNSVLAEMQSDLDSMIQVRKARMENLSYRQELEVAISNKQTDIIAQQAITSNNQIIISGIDSQIVSITTSLDIDSTENFTTSQRLELDNFIFVSSYTNDSIISTSEMTFNQTQEVSLVLYNDGVAALAKLAIPRYTISISSANFLALKEFEVFNTNINPGDKITVDSGKGYFFDATLLELGFSWDDPTDFSITLSNRQRIDDSHFIFTDLMNESLKASRNQPISSTNVNDLLAINSALISLQDRLLRLFNV
jgi:hypothetical protein